VKRVALIAIAILVTARGALAGVPSHQFVNPIGEGADPWVVRDPNGGRYLWCLSEGNRAIAVHTSKQLTSLGEKHVVWRAPKTGPVSRQVWAPELHFLDDRWHIYFAASDGKNENHLAYVLRSASSDPLGPYELHGPMATGDGMDRDAPNVWAIDMTPLERGGRRYALWSGWDAPGSDRQYTYIARMKSPIALEGPRVRICANDDYAWERTEPGERGRGLNEGPQVLKRGRRTFVIYSCGASWLPTYKLGLLELTGTDPLDPKSWTKHAKPVFASSRETYGVGHSCFAESPDGKEWWHIFHAKRDRRPGWRRAVFVQRMAFTKNGFPLFGTPVTAGVPLVRPSGETLLNTTLPLRSALHDGSRPGWRYYGHHQFIKYAEDGLHLGCVPDNPINSYRCGEKIVLDSLLPSDFSVEVTVNFLGNSQARDAGILFRATGPAIGYDAQRGYFAGVIPRANRIILGKTDGQRWRELGRASVQIDTGAPQRLSVEAIGSQICVSLNGEPGITIADGTYPDGAVGLRVVDTHVVFSDLAVQMKQATP